MPTTTLGRNLHMCFTKMKHLGLDDGHPFPFPSSSSTSASASSSSSSQSSILVKNFNSLYDDNTTTTTTTASTTLSSELEPEYDSEPDFATIFASQRFFFTSPGLSNSITESTPSSITTAELSSDTPVGMISPVKYSAASNQLSANKLSSSPSPSSSQDSIQSWKCPSVKDSIAVPTDSPDPYMDFRRSMQEMVEARDLVGVTANWDYLHELLLCYLELNAKSTHKFIIGAFADLLVSLMPSSEEEEEEKGGSREAEFPTTNTAGGGVM